jgi:excisionase family DNA binding protein
VAPTDLITAAGVPDESIPQLVSSFERAACAASATSLAQLLGSLERLKAIVWAQLLAVSGPAERLRPEPLEELRHLTPNQVAELLSLKEAYIHELCRSRQIPATKKGKYWIIPVAELREWLVRARGIDPRRAGSVGLPAQPGIQVPSRGGPDRPLAKPTGTRRRQRTTIHRIQQQVAPADSAPSSAEDSRSR